MIDDRERHFREPECCKRRNKKISCDLKGGTFSDTSFFFWCVKSVPIHLVALVVYCLKFIIELILGNAIYCFILTK